MLFALVYWLLRRLVALADWRTDQVGSSSFVISCRSSGGRYAGLACAIGTGCSCPR